MDSTSCTVTKHPAATEPLEAPGSVSLRILPGRLGWDDEAPAVLREIGRHRTEIPGLGRAACFGSYAQVVTAGTVSVGDPATIAV